MFTFMIKPDGGDAFEVTAGTRDVLKWERTTKGASLGQLKEGITLGALYKIAHLAATRQQLFTGPLADFEDTCELEFEEDEEPDPTRPAP
ncbi:hypothetical protein AB0I37_24905 [Micromonospora purpureochromogenes]|uniref:hypothetical protein n=1 Tax=Micromonospora purpureochromogenes TaxID=47872 RepID=UPI0033F6A126